MATLRLEVTEGDTPWYLEDKARVREVMEKWMKVAEGMLRWRPRSGDKIHHGGYYRTECGHDSRYLHYRRTFPRCPECRRAVRWELFGVIEDGGRVVPWPGISGQ